jgi:hypothetical protein
MATPHVAGAVAFLHSVASADLSKLIQENPAAGARAIKDILIHSVDPIPSLQGATVSGGRLNLNRAAQMAAEFSNRRGSTALH